MTPIRARRGRRQLVSGHGACAGGRGRRHLAPPTRSRSCAGDLVALIAPHAGLMYSGPVAAHAYRLLAAARSTSWCSSVRRISSASTACRSYRPAASRRRWASRRSTRDCAQPRSRGVAPIIREHPAAHAREHSLEMQLPFLQRLAPGAADRAAGDGLSDRGDGVARSATRSPRRSTAGARCSSPAPICPITTTPRPRRGSTRRHRLRVAASTPTAAARARRSDPDHACGGGPTVAVMRAARHARRARCRCPRLRGFGRRVGRQVQRRGLPGGGVRTILKTPAANAEIAENNCLCVLCDL